MARSRWLVALFIVGVAASLGQSQTSKHTEYPFEVPPLEMYDRLDKLKVAKMPPIGAADRKILTEIWAARSATPPKSLSQADDEAVIAHLIAGGVSDPAARTKYLNKFTDLAALCKRPIAGAKNDREKADLLLRHLHKTVMAKGYDLNQTTLHGIFDTGKFNCVSSAELYFLVGTRLGLKLQPVLIPGTPGTDGHAAVDLLDGKERIEIEPTNADGFDAATKRKQPGVLVTGSLPDRSTGYDADGFGLAASAASNLGIDATKASTPRPADGARWDVIALVLAPGDPGVAKNTVATISNWGLEASKAKKHEDAVKIYALARECLGDKGHIEKNYSVAWEHYLDEVFSAGKVEEGLKLLPQAAAAFPKEERYDDPSLWVTRAATRKADKDGWAAGIALADAAMKLLPEGDAKTVQAWKATSRRLWSQKLLDKGDADGSLKVLADGLKEDPKSTELLDGLAYHTQEALAALAKAKGSEAAVAHFKELCERFPKNEGVRKAGLRHAAREVNRLSDAKKFDEAIQLAEAYQPLAGDALDEIKADVFDGWGQSLARAGKWDDAVAKYVEGLEACPRNKRLSNNVIVVIDEWAEKSMDRKDWAEAIRIYEIGLKHFPDDSHLKHNRDYCRKQRDGK